MGIDTLDQRSDFADHIEQVAHAGDIRGVLDEASYGDYDATDNQMNLLPTKTFREPVCFGGDASDHTVFMNNGQMMVVPIPGENGDRDAVVLEVQEREHRRGLRTRRSKMLVQYTINDVFGDEPVITLVAEPEPIKPNQVIEIDPTQFGGYVKAFRRGTAPVKSSEAQRMIQTRGLSPDQEEEFGLVGASLRALGYS
jgi:hypothetical protein